MPKQYFKFSVIFFEGCQTCYVCCIFSNVLQTTVTMETNIMNPDQTAPLFAIFTANVCQQLTMQTKPSDQDPHCFQCSDIG